MPVRKYYGRGGAEAMPMAPEPLEDVQQVAPSDYVELVYNEVVNSRSSTAESFAKGQMDFNFSASGITSWIPSKSYVRLGIRVERSKIQADFPGENTEYPTMSDLVAPAFSLPDTLFQSWSLLGGGASISTLPNNCSQAGTLRRRLKSSYAFKESMGAVHGIDASFGKRQKMICSDAKYSGDNYELVPLTNDPAHQRGTGGAQCTVSITALTGAVVGVNTQLNAVGLGVGDSLVVNGVEYVISVAADTPEGGALRVANGPSVDVAATVDCYGIKRKSLAHNRNKFYVNFTPPLGVFDVSDALPSGQYTLRCNTIGEFDIHTNCLESLLGSSTESPPAKWKIYVDSCSFYVATVKTNLMNSQVSLPLVEYSIQSKPISGPSTTYNFSVESSTRGIVLFIQSDEAGKNMRIPGSMFKTLDNKHLKVQGIQVNYANCRKNSAPFASGYGDTYNLLQQLYKNTFEDANLADVNGVGAESFEDWLSCGCFYYFSFLKGDDKSTECQITLNMEEKPEKASLYCVAIHGNLVELTSANGSLVSVKSRLI